MILANNITKLTPKIRSELELELNSLIYAASVASANLREFIEWLEEQGIHYVITPDGFKFKKDKE